MRNSIGPSLFLGAMIALAGVLLVTVAGCSGVKPPDGWPSNGPYTVRPHDADGIDADELKGILQARDQRITKLISENAARWRSTEATLSKQVDERLTKAVDEAAQVAAMRTTSKLNARLEEWFVEAGVEQKELQDKIRDAIGKEVSATVRTEAAAAARTQAEELRESIAGDREAAIAAAETAAVKRAEEVARAEAKQLETAVGNAEAGLIERIGQRIRDAAPIAKAVPGYGNALSWGLTAIGTLIVGVGGWFGGRRKKENEMIAEQRTVPTTKAA